METCVPDTPTKSHCLFLFEEVTGTRHAIFPSQPKGTKHCVTSLVTCGDLSSHTCGTLLLVRRTAGRYWNLTYLLFYIDRSPDRWGKLLFLASSVLKLYGKIGKIFSFLGELCDMQFMESLLFQRKVGITLLNDGNSLVRCSANESFKT